ncbi:Major facilitator superfamily domain general substrate transporter, partial [Penicillium coprophilum]|uniref:Major facilitator superfamily domain general substrate transporter n=1 Tax=Penicillium coprophilum TaxID=36646 RepID=UPI0023986246
PSIIAYCHLAFAPPSRGAHVCDDGGSCTRVFSSTASGSIIEPLNIKCSLDIEPNYPTVTKMVHYRTMRAVSSIINYFHTVSIGMVLFCIPALHLRVPVRVRTIVGILLNHILLCSYVHCTMPGLGFTGDMAGFFAVMVHIMPLNKCPMFAALTACGESLAIIAAHIGIGTTTSGYYALLMTFGSVRMPIAAGLVATSDLHKSLAKIILHSGFVDFTGGIGFQAPQAGYIYETFVV